MVSENLAKVRENHYFSKDVLKMVIENYKNFGKILNIKQFIGGQSNPTFFIISESGNELILRKKPPGKLLPSAHAVEREYKIQKALMNSHIPCPKMFALCEDSKIINFLHNGVYKESN